MPDFSKSLQNIIAVSRASGPSESMISRSDNTSRRTYMNAMNEYIRYNQEYTHEIKVNMRIENVHELAHLLIYMLRTLYPFRVRMGVPDKLCEVDDPTQHIAESIKMFDDLEELIP